MHINVAKLYLTSSMWDLLNISITFPCFSFPTKILHLLLYLNFKPSLQLDQVHFSLVAACFYNPNYFVTNSSSYVGIKTIQHWTQKVGMMIVLDTSCNGDLIGLTCYSSCVDGGMKITSQFVVIGPNLTKCFYFSINYDVGIVNQFGPKDPSIASCILGMPLSRATTKGSSNKDGVLKLVFFYYYWVMLLVFYLLFHLSSCIGSGIENRRKIFTTKSCEQW